MTQLFISKLAQSLVGGESGGLPGYAQDVATTAGRTTLLVGGVGAAGAGYLANRALDEETLTRAAKGLSSKLKLPITIAAALIGGMLAAKHVGVPAGVAVGAATGGRRSPPPTDPDSARVRYVMGG